MIGRRAMLGGLAALGGPAALGGCGLSERPYLERREWPLLVTRPRVVPTPPGAPVLELRGLQAAPGLEARGLQSVQPDGSIRTAFYEEWAVPPAEAAEDAWRRWLIGSGRFAVVGPGSGIAAELVLSGELTALWAEPARRRVRAAIGWSLTRRRDGALAVLRQETAAAEPPLATDAPGDQVQAETAALALVFAAIEALLPG